jgi:hypothetical protein
MTESATGTIKFYVRSGISPLPGTGIWTSIDRMTWHYRGYTDSVGMLMVQGVPSGLNYYMASKTGYGIGSGSVNVPSGGGVQVNIYLTKTLSIMSADIMGSLDITSNPTGAHVSINGELLDTLTPVTITDIPEGEYILELAKDGHQATTVVRIARGRTATSTASLSPT